MFEMTYTDAIKSAGSDTKNALKSVNTKAAAALKGLEMVIGKKPAVKVAKKASADDTINQFLKQMGW